MVKIVYILIGLGSTATLSIQNTKSYDGPTLIWLRIDHIVNKKSMSILNDLDF